MKKDIIIIGEKTTIAKKQITFETNKLTETKYLEDIVMSENNGQTTRANCLKAINDALKFIALQDESKRGIYVIHTLGIVFDAISNKTPVYWLQNGGKKNDGESIDPRELALWNDFFDLYAKTFRSVIFKNASDPQNAINFKKSRYPVSTDTKRLAEIISEMWENVKAKSSHVEELEIEDILF